MVDRESHNHNAATLIEITLVLFNRRERREAEKNSRVKRSTPLLVLGALGVLGG
jgi:hypothetical protein